MACFKFKGNLAGLLVYLDPMVIRFSRHDFDRDFPNPFRRKPRNVIAVLYDPHPEVGVSLLDFGNGVYEHVLGHIPIIRTTIVTIE